ncbi:MAG: 8-amino-7-oxononanoate synthase [Syntrophales bacterium]|nr:8-amino-7-oxononanoate synthase [Syntrophales bacterium]
MFAERYTARLRLQHQAGLYRNPPEVGGREGSHLLVGGERVLNFASNDYLGLGTSTELRHMTAANFRRYGTSSSSSRLASGNYTVINEAERAYAAYFGYDDAIFFPSGYQANMAVISTFLDKGDTAIFDKHVHASSVKGMVMSGADFYGYNHNSLTHLEKRLDAHRDNQAAVLTESLFSMDGDLLDVSGLSDLKERYSFLTIVDEAHAFGALGIGGRGIASSVADIAVGTFGKAFGLFGAFVLLPRGFKEYLFNFASPLMYTTALPEAHAATAMLLLDMIASSEERRIKLGAISAFMKECLIREGFRVSGDAHILALEIGEEAKAATLAQLLLEKKIFVMPARYPTVPRHQAILRIGLTALHEKGDVNLFIEHLKDVYGSLE